MMAPAKGPQTEIEALQLELIIGMRKDHQQRRQEHGVYLFIFVRSFFFAKFDRKLCVCVCVCVCVSE